FCGEEIEQPLEDISIDEDEWNAPSENDESSYWDNYGDYYYDYDWEERDNPCSNSYYGDRRTVRQNILASNLGLIAKMGNSGELFVAVTNILTAQPLAKINIQALDFQQKSIGEGTTDDNGWLRLSLDTKPFLIIADDGQQKGYLKVDDGSSLSLSSFDIGGSRVQKGLKGFLYGERGVWRPGDSLYITFILEDKETVLPEGHPVVFEMYDPLGKLTTRMVNTQGKNGFYSFRTKTEEQAITGNWMGKVKVGGAEFNKSLKIETVKPNRLKINLDFEQDIITSEERYLEGQLEVKWLHGAPGRNLRTSFDVLLTSGKTTFPGYEEFQFDNPENRYYSEQNTVYDGLVDEDGLANVSLSIHAENNPPGMLNALFMGKAWEPGGDFSINNFSIPFYPYKSFTGIRTPKGDKARGMLLTDTTHTIEIATVDAMGDPVSSDAVYVELFKLDWRWWWDQGSSGANYISGNSKTKLSGGSIETRNGKGTWQFRVDYPDWGRYYLKACDNNSGHCTGKVIYIDWPGWAGRAERDNPGGASMLSFSADKRDYKVGEQVRLDIPGSAKGRALISVETGSKVLNTYWLETQSGENTFMIEATPDMAPGAYIHVTMIQEHAQTINDLPIRMYGVIPVFVNDPQTVLQPQLAMADALAPGEKVNLEISEVSGKPMTYTIAVVDEGLLDLTNYRTPDPWSVFYAREALGVKTWDLYEFVMGAYGGKLERLLAIGGGEGEAGDSKGKVNRFKPVVKYLGPFELKQGASNKHNFTMPQYVGAVKTMVIAGHDGAYGKTEKSTPVKQPVMVLGTLPRVLGPGERVDLPVNIFAMEEDIKQVTVQVSASDILSSTGSESRTVSFQRVGDQTVSFSYQVADRLGTGKVKITAKAGNYSATHEIEIAVRNPNPLVTNFDQSLINAGETWSTEYAFPGIAGTNSGLLEISSIPPIDFGRRLKYLISYPHGCIEQTTSSVFPQLFISDIMQTDEKQKVQMEQNIKAGISRIRQFQLPNGGLAYWPGNAHADIWGTNYAGHFLLVAREKGYDVPPSVIRKWKSFQSKEASQWRKHPSNQRDDLIQAYRLYTLALEGSPEKGAMNRLRESKNLSVQAAWRLAAAYALAGQPEAAKELIKNRTFQIAEYSEQGQSFGTALRDKAMILETLGLLKAFNRGGELLLDISKELSKTNLWLSTQTTAYCLIGVGQFAGMSKNGKGLNFTYALNNETKDAKTDLPMSQIPIDTKNMTGNISVTNKGTGLLYARLALTGAPARGAETDSETNLRMTVKYTDMDGYSIDPESLEQGTSFLAEVSIMNTGLKGNYENLALTQIFPSGWEIINLRLADTNLSQSDFDYQDIRDDRVYTYFDLRANQRKKFSVVLNASYVGAYYLPAVSCEAMYDKSVSSVKKGMEVNVVRPGEL
ncbi:MAG: MG2 domain-containing protein, partial [Cyclobacteriaceae bacterium]|nr:MG2 domain-containing protein [Cyclobacteriaceae bacterium]